MQREEVMTQLKKLLVTIRTVDSEKVQALSEDSDFFVDLDIPSTDLVNVIAKAEEHFDVEFDDDDVDELGSKIKDTIDLILKSKSENQ